ncbi:Plasmodium exported protein (PHISTa-like), putative [Plasmodium sp. gorilla clade G3]|nr:Plasmodium exported protein (PHISTa-like), putative [Plasmodium sp. gorilla clade G3]
MKYCCVEYYSEETHIKNTNNVCSFSRIFLNLLSITGILLLNSIILYDKNKAYDEGVYDIYRRNLSELKNVQHSWLRSSSENLQLQNTVDQKNNTLPISQSSNSQDNVKYSDVTTKDKCNNINYNDLSKQLTMEELDNVLYNLDERPSNIDLYNIWNQVLGVSKEGFDDMLKDLSYYIEEYLLTYEYQRYHYIRGRRPVCVGTEYSTWYKSMHYIGEALSSTDMENTLKFYKLIKDGASIDEMKDFIYSYINYYETLKNDLYNEHKRIFTERMKNPQRLNI